MTKILLTLSLFFLAVLKLSAQCTPDPTITKPGFYPDTLPNAMVKTAYNQVIHFKIIKDTLTPFGMATIDSAFVDSVTGMPNGLTFHLNKPSKKYTPEETGCALISGTPTRGGTFPLKIYLKLHGKLGSIKASQPQVIDHFAIVVTHPSGIVPIVNSSKSLYPNPLISDKLTINSGLVSPGTIISIYSSQGQLVASQIFDGSQSSISFNYPKGLYWVSLVNGDKVSRVKLVKE